MYRSKYGDPYEEIYADYTFDQSETRQNRRKRKAKAVHKAKKTEHEIVQDIADANAVEGIEFKISYKPTRHEEGWLLDSLGPLFQQELIVDIVGRIKGGKEASVYVCKAHESSPVAYMAAKVYRPIALRNMRNYSVYKQGREILAADGSEIHDNNLRAQRALNKKSRFGQQLSHISWLMYEYKTLELLKEAGADVPQVYGMSANAILMDYIGTDGMAAPSLHEVDLQDEAHILYLYEQTMKNVEIMLSKGWTHGDLSAYNILYWNQEIVFIDFPQVVDCHNNPDAYEIFKRDIEHVGDYFEGYGLDLDIEAQIEALWEKYIGE
ncbi:hypothetical protein MASR2M15_23830 [Anaerolineales bacterium]